MADDDNEQRSPFARRGFIAAAGVVAVVAILGITLGIVNATQDDPDPDPTGSNSAPSPSASTSAPPTPEPTEAAGGASVCGLGGVALDGSLSTAPAADWQYQDTTAYPTSAEYGPGDVSSEGLRSCFQHSPEGAVFTAANAVVQGSDPATVGAWLDYFIADGPNRDAVLAQGTGVEGSSGQGVRLEVAGFRLLAYDGETARVDIAVRGAADGQTVSLSMVYLLVWEDGDWKLSVTDPNLPINVANVPDLAGYITWGE